MAEVREEASHVPQHRLRIAFFLSAMRHFRDELRERGLSVHYAEMGDRANRGSFAGEIERWSRKLRPDRLVVVKPGDWRVEKSLKETSRKLDLDLEIREDDHFLCSTDEFDEFAEGRERLVMEHFYRHMRRRLDVLVTDGRPDGGRWNFDADNRESFGAKGPPGIKAPRSFRPDDTTQAVLRYVARAFPESPGRLDEFDYPVTRRQARAALRDFVRHRLEHFGRYQDAMAAGRPYLYHSRLSCVLNVHLLGPLEVVEAIVDAGREHKLPMGSVEGFVRQVVGWREFVRGVYWKLMPEYAERNSLGADVPAPAFLWTGETDMNCVRECVGQLVRHAYAHHIQRLMVLGLHALLLGVRPDEFNRWHLSMYADAVDWVSLPNALGMSQHADGGVVGTKPYCASGNYIHRMSDYCRDCRYDPKKATGDDACPFTTLYWDFLARHRARFGRNPRMGNQVRNLDRKPASEVRSIRRAADSLKDDAAARPYL